MKTLTIASAVSVLCTLSIWLFTVPPLVRNGQVDVDAGFELMVVFPTLLGLPASLVGAVAGGVVLIRHTSRGWPGPTMAAGQLLTWSLAAAIIVWAMAFATSGWELLALPFALMLGQLVVAAGLAAVVVRRLRGAPRQTA